MKKFNFLCNWLLFSMLFFALFGLIVACFGDSSLFDFYNQQLIARFWHTTQLPDNVKEFKAFLFGPLGGTIAGKYVVMAYIVYYPFRQKEKWAWNALLVGQVVWFVVDSSVSFYYQAYFNILVINIMPMIIIGIPLLLARKYFVKIA